MSLLDFPDEITCVLDGYEPRLAPVVIEAVREIHNEVTFTLMWDLICDEAWERTIWN